MWWPVTKTDDISLQPNVLIQGLKDTEHTVLACFPRTLNMEKVVSELKKKREIRKNILPITC